MKTVDKIYEHVSYALSYDKTGLRNQDDSKLRSGTNWPMVAFVLFYICVIAYVFYKLYFINIGAEPVADELPKVPATLGGWLILVLIGLVIRPFSYLIQLFTSNYFNADRLNELAAENGFWTLGITFEVIANVTLLIFSVFLLILFLSHRNSLPRFYIIFLVLTTIVNLLDAFIINILLEKETPSSVYTLVGVLIGCAIWIPYFLISQRVKETFVVRYKKKNGSN